MKPRLWSVMMKESGSGEKETKGRDLTSFRKRLNRISLSHDMGMHLLGGRGDYDTSRREYKLSKISGNSWGKLVASPCQTFPSEWVFFPGWHGEKSHKLSKLACSVPRSKYKKNVWLYIKRKLQSRSGAVKSKADLIEEIRRIWTGITPAYIQSLYGSISKRVQQVIQL